MCSLEPFLSRVSYLVFLLGGYTKVFATRNKSLLLGIGVGLLFGLGMVAGTVIGLKSEQNAATFEIDGMVLKKAAGSDSSDNFSLATGAISDQAEGAFFWMH